MESMQKTILAAVLCGSLFTGASADETHTVTGAARIIVTATRSPDDIRKVAGNPSVITAQEIAAGHYSSVADALAKKAGIFFRNYADNPSQATVDLRGFGGDNPHGKVLVLIDGRKLNRPDMASINWAQIPLQAVERIEVVRGPNSVLYGDHAVSGVINIITREATSEPQTTLAASIGSHQSQDQSLVTSGRLDGLGYVVTAGHQSGEGYRDQSSYDSTSVSLRLNGQLTDQLSAYAGFSAVQEQHELPGALTAAQVSQDRTQSVNPDDEADETYYNFNTGIEALLTEDLMFNLDGGLSRKELQADIASWFSYYDYTITSYSLSPKLTVLSPMGNLDNELILGADLAREILDTQTYGNAAHTTQLSDTQATKDLIGVYITDALCLTDTLRLNGGLRLEKNRLRVDHDSTFATSYDESTSQTENAWQAQLTWLPADAAKLFAGIKSTYRYPFVDEQAIYSGWGDAFNKDLKPETGLSYETGVEITPVSNLTLGVTAFITDMKNEIAWSGTQNENLDETTHRGIELSAAYQNELFALDTYYTWLQSEFTAGSDKGNEIPWVPQNKLDINLAIFLTDALTASTHVSYVGSMVPLGDTDNDSTATQSGYTLVDLLLEYQWTLQRCEATVFAGIDNVFGTEYNYLVTDYGWGAGYYPAAEQTYKTGIRLTF
jgi:iron complex outermembrane receptor protein